MGGEGIYDFLGEDLLLGFGLESEKRRVMYLILTDHDWDGWMEWIRIMRFNATGTDGLGNG